MLGRWGVVFEGCQGAKQMEIQAADLSAESASSKHPVDDAIESNSMLGGTTIWI